MISLRYLKYSSSWKPGSLPGAHHTGFSKAIAKEHQKDFSEIAGIGFLLIDQDTTL